ncbi:MAG: NUDIX domain-containing protein, partial [Patescibacteria group bacterium]
INPQNFSELVRKHKVGDFNKITKAMPLEKYLRGPLSKDDKKELRFVPKIEAVRFRDPRGKNFTGFRSVLKDGAIIFAQLPGDLLPVCAEFRHGCERVMLNLPAGLIEPSDQSPKVRAKKEFEEETGIALKKLVPLNRGGIPIDARVLTGKNFFFLGIPKKPLTIRPQKTHKGEFVARFIVRFDDWLKFMEMGMVDDCSITGTLLAFKKLKMLQSA